MTSKREQTIIDLIKIVKAQLLPLEPDTDFETNFFDYLKITVIVHGLNGINFADFKFDESDFLHYEEDPEATILIITEKTETVLEHLKKELEDAD